MTPKSIVECCDCMDFMAKFPDKYFDLAICDPPYGIRIDKSFSNDNGKPGAEQCSCSPLEKPVFVKHQGLLLKNQIGIFRRLN